MSAETSTITSTTMSKSCSSGSASRAFRTAVNVHAFLAFRFAAQYFFIRTLTAFRAAADIPRRRRFSFFAASRPESFAMMNESGSSSLSNESRRCGNNSTSSLTSCFKSSRRASAPRLASAKILDECFAIDASISNKRVPRHACQLSSPLQDRRLRLRRAPGPRHRRRGPHVHAAATFPRVTRQHPHCHQPAAINGRSVSR